MKGRLGKLYRLMTMVVSAGCSVAVLTSYLGLRAERGTERRRAAVIAIRLASDLERFAYHCSDIAIDFDSGAEQSDLAKRLPKLPNWRPDGDWQGLSNEEREAILSMPLKIDAADAYILSAVRFEHADDAAEATRDSAVLLGATAWQMAAEMRKHWGYAPLQLVQPFDADLVRRAANLTAAKHAGDWLGTDPR